MKTAGAWLGSRIGGRTGLVLAAIYSSPFIMFWFLSPGAALLTIVLTILLGLAPATLAGMFSGALVGGILQWVRRPASNWTALLISLAVSIPVAIGGNLTLGRAMASDELVAYWYFLGVPSGLYILANAWVSVRVHMQLAKQALRVPLSSQGEQASGGNAMMIIAGGIFVLTGVLVLVYGSIELMVAESVSTEFERFAIREVVWLVVAVVTGVATLIVYGNRGGRRANEAPIEPGNT